MNEVEYHIQRAITFIDEIKVDIALLRLRLALRNYNPLQPRWPAGRPEGGQWRPSGGETAQAEGIYDPSRAGICDLQLERDHDLCRMAKTPRCWESADIRHANCMRNVYIPRLEVGR